jgi:hypothetical protein
VEDPLLTVRAEAERTVELLRAFVWLESPEYDPRKPIATGFGQGAVAQGTADTATPMGWPNDDDGDLPDYVLAVVVADRM